MTDQFSAYSEALDSPASSAAGVTPDDATDLSDVSRALYIGGTGDVAVTMKSGDAVTFKNVIGGTVLAIRVSRVLSTGTTATDIVAMH